MSLSDTDAYEGTRARRYAEHHRKSLRTRLTTAREQQVLYRSLADAGFPETALDLPCGTGRFWPAFARAGVKELIAGDGSPGMLEVADTHRLNASIPAQLLQTSAFNIALPERSVDFVACLRFYHHLSRAEDRATLLAELKRVTRRFVAISLWVDGNLAGNRRARKPPPGPVAGYGKRICRRREEVEAEFAAAGFAIVRHYDVWPRIAMWRLYLLEL
jgi:SAM-dependent methyltransferase